MDIFLVLYKTNVVEDRLNIIEDSGIGQGLASVFEKKGIQSRQVIFANNSQGQEDTGAMKMWSNISS